MDSYRMRRTGLGCRPVAGTMMVVVSMIAMASRLGWTLEGASPALQSSVQTSARAINRGVLRSQHHARSSVRRQLTRDCFASVDSSLATSTIPAAAAAAAASAEPVNFPQLKNDLLLRAARGQATERVPVWIHRQAGRYLPEFRSIAEKHGYMKCFNTPEIAADLTVQPVHKYAMDAAILFSDILVLLPLMGVEWQISAGVEPFAVNAIKTGDDVESTLVDADTVDIHDKLGYVLESVKLTRHKLEGKAPLIGFSGAPWTLLTYTMHTAESNGRENALEFIKKYPEAATKILDNATKLVVKYLIAKVEAGAQMLQVFDSWAGILSKDDFDTFSKPYLLKIAKEVKAGIKAKVAFADSNILRIILSSLLLLFLIFSVPSL